MHGTGLPFVYWYVKNHTSNAKHSAQIWLIAMLRAFLMIFFDEVP